MNRAVAVFNHAITGLWDFLLWPFSAVPPVWGLSFASLLAGILLLLIYKRISNQSAIRAAKSRIGRALLEVVLFRHDFKLCLRAQGLLLRETWRYFLLALPPVLVLTAPCLIILAQLNQRYGLRPFQAGEAALLRAHIEDPADLFNVALLAPPHIEVSHPVRVASSNEIYWRIKSRESGGALKPLDTVTLSAGGWQVSKAVIFGAGNGWLEPLAARSWFWSIFYPSRRPLSARAPVRELALSYPDIRYRLFGAQLHWLLFFFVISLTGGLAASRIFKVEI